MPEWLQVDWLLSQFSGTQPAARRRYAEFVRAGRAAPDPWADLKQQIYLGSDAFIARQQKHLTASGDLSKIPRAQLRAPPKPLSSYAKRHGERRAAMAAAYRSGHYSLAAIARYFGVHYSTVSRAVKKAEKR